MKCFMELFDVPRDIICDKREMKHLLNADAKAFVRYLAGGIEKLHGE